MYRLRKQTKKFISMDDFLRCTELAKQAKFSLRETETSEEQKRNLRETKKRHIFAHKVIKQH
ncbi:MAG: hypothetical protein KBS94_00025 [Prevotella sp.]|nr:hypothetical protein [Candidatus Equicola faecalis]